MSTAGSNSKTRIGLRSLALLVVQTASEASENASGGDSEAQFWDAIADLISLRYPASVSNDEIQLTEREWYRLGEYMGFRNRIKTRRFDVIAA